MNHRSLIPASARAFVPLSALALMLAAGFGVGSSRDVPVSDEASVEPGRALTVMPDSIDLGDVRPGHRAEGRLRLRNPSSKTVVLDRVDSNCPCVRVFPARAEIRPNGSLDLRITFDPAEEPDFRGGLFVDQVGRGPSGEALFRATVRLTVADPADRRPKTGDRP